MLKLIINADDFGFTKGCNDGIITALKEGLATDTTIMINMEDSSDAVEKAKQSGIKRIGLHLNLTCGKPVLPPERVSSLVDENGNFYRRAAMLLPNMNLKEAEAELWSQVEKFTLTGMGLTHIDSHHHIHMYEGLTDIVIDIARKLEIPLRQTNDAVKEKIINKGVKTTDHFTMKFYGDGATLENLCSILDRYEDGVMEIMTHPAIPDQKLLSTSSYNIDREKELEVLTSEAMSKYILNRGIRMISFDEISLK